MTVVIPPSFRYITLMLVLANSLATMLFEKLVVSRCMAPISQLRREIKRIDLIEGDMEKCRNEMYKVNNRFSVPRRMLGERHLTTAMRQVQREAAIPRQSEELKQEQQR
jgi:hypothetical protein